MMLGRFAGRPLLVRVAAPCHLRSMRTSAASGAAPMRSGAAVTGVRRAVAAASAWSRRGLFTPGALREAAGSAAAMATAPAPTKYSLGMMALHWGMAAAIGTTVGAVKLAQWTPKEDKKRKGELMKLHKSTALIVVALLVPRLAMRLFTKHPPAPEGHAIEKFAGHVSHTLLYAAMIFLPASGIAMGYFGGKGLPFFEWTIPGSPTPDKAIAGGAFKRHKQVGELFTYLLPIHVGAVGFHYVAKSQNLLLRMLP